MPIIIAEQTRDGARIIVPVVDAVIRTIKDQHIDVAIIDPFVSSHRVTENDNNAIELVAKKWAMIADATNCAIELVHHSRKTGAELTVQDGRGAVALLAAARSARVLNVMSEDEAAQAGVENRKWYFRADNGKANLAPPAEKAEWFNFVSVPLGNGDHVGVPVPWQFPNAFDGVTTANLREAQKAVALADRGGKTRRQTIGWGKPSPRRSISTRPRRRAGRRSPRCSRHGSPTGCLSASPAKTPSGATSEPSLRWANGRPIRFAHPAHPRVCTRSALCAEACTPTPSIGVWGCAVQTVALHTPRLRRVCSNRAGRLPAIRGGLTMNERHLVRVPDDLVEEVKNWAEKFTEDHRKGDPLQAMPWTRDLMTDEELRAWRASRKEAGRVIDIETCEIERWYANANGDPYGIGEMLGEEDHLDKGYTDKFDFVRSPDSNGWVCIVDLPHEKGVALYDRIHRDRAGDARV